VPQDRQQSGGPTVRLVVLPDERGTHAAADSRPKAAGRAR
jgi:hypothetical protein